MIALSVLVPAGALGQTNDEINAGLQFSFSSPGARSLAMGGAFSGLADDATAAYANPAGLIWLSRSEVSLEGRYRSYKTRYPDIGNASGVPRGLGLDTRGDLLFSERSSQTEGLSFLSYVHHFKKRWRLAVYQHQLADFKAEISSRGPFIRSTNASGQARSRLAGVQGSLELEVRNTGLATAFQATENFWIGFGISLYEFAFDATTRRYQTILPRSGNGQAIFGPVELVEANERDRHLQKGDDSDIAGHLGLIWKGKSNRWSLGLVYHQAPSFEFRYEFLWGQKAIANAIGDADGDGIIESFPNPDFVDPAIPRVLSGESSFEVPSVLSLGFKFQPTVVWTLSFEYTRVNYSSLEPENNILYFGVENLNTCGDFSQNGTPQNIECINSQDRLDRFVVDDADEFHVGLEYVIRRPRQIALRLGAWLDPDHQMRFENPERIGPPEDRFEPRFRPGSDEIHLTGGFGWVVGDFQFDFGVDLSDRAEIASLSTVYRF